METFVNPVIGGDDVDHGDPFVLRHLGRYWLYHTGGRAVPVYESEDLVSWRRRGSALEAADPPHWAETDLWAPEVLYDHGSFYMYVAGTRRGEGGGGRDALRRQGLARGSEPAGPFALDARPLVGDQWSIDGHPHRDDDGSLWLFYNVRTAATRYRDGTTGTGNVVGRLLAVDELEGRPERVVFPDARWEGSRNGDFYWNEGPWVLRRRGGYYQMYSGSSFAEPSYAVGGAWASSPRGPWAKDRRNPIFRGGGRIRGPGHHCVVRAPDGVTPYAVYHGRLPGERGRKVHIDRLWWAGDRPVIGRPRRRGRSTPTDASQPLPPRSVHDPAVPHWHCELWARGRVLLAGVALDLAGDHARHVCASRYGDRLTVWVDGVLRPADPAPSDGAPSDGAPSLGGDGEIVARALTSCLEVEEIVELARGETRSWPWGGSAPVEVALAARGRLELRVGERTWHVRAPRRRYRLVVVLVPDGADEISVTAARGGATVTDLFAAAREPGAGAPAWITR